MQKEEDELSFIDPGYQETFVRARIARLAYIKGGPVLDIGTGACGCMATTLIRRGLRVTAIDLSLHAVQEVNGRVADSFYKTLEILRADAASLPFLTGAYRTAVAFDMLCHVPDPGAILREMFRVSSGMVIISELNSAGCQVVHHDDKGFDSQLPGLLIDHCQDCLRLDDAHHTTYVCENAKETV